MMELLMSYDDPVGPLETARENLECFADSLIQQTLLKSIVAVYSNSFAAVSLLSGDETLEQIQELWVAIADDWEDRGISA